MASVPNMRLGPAALPGAADQPGDAAEALGFAQLLSALPADEAGAGVEIALGAAPPDESEPGEASADEAEAILELVARQASDPLNVTVPPPPPAPADGAVTVRGAQAAPSHALAGGPAAPGRAPEAPILAGSVVPARAPEQAAETPDLEEGSEIPAEAKPLKAAPQAPAAAAKAGTPAAAAEGAPSLPTPGTAAPTAAEAPRQDAGPKPPAQTGAPEAQAAAKAPPRSPIAELALSRIARAEPGEARGSVRSPVATLAAAVAADAASPAPSVQPTATVAAPVVPPPFAAQPALPAAAEPMAARGADLSELLAERQLALAADGEWLDQLARDIARAGAADGRMRFRLNPEHLGTLRVELTQSEQGTSVRLIADSEAARALIADAQPRLLAEARAQGVRIAETHVDLAGGQAGDPRRHDAERREGLVRTAREQSPESESDGRERPRESADRYA